MEIETIVTGLIQTNTYLVISESGKEAVLVDPAADVEEILAEIKEKDINLKAILITHGHFDHIGAADELKQQYDVPVYAHEKEAEMMANGKENMSVQLLGMNITAQADSYIIDGETLDFGNGLTFNCIVVPGHTNNSVCYYNETYDFVITGDTLMAGAIGRTDFNNTKPSVLVNNIKEKLLVLPGKTVVYSGHGYKTTIKDERTTNPFLLK